MGYQVGSNVSCIVLNGEISLEKCLELVSLTCLFETDSVYPWLFFNREHQFVLNKSNCGELCEELFEDFLIEKSEFCGSYLFVHLHF